jgi:hypothetical protein
MKRLFMIVTVALLAVACNKNQSAVKKLDGEWDVTKMLITEDGKSIDIIGLGASSTMSFQACKLKDNEYCDMSVTTTFDGDTGTETGVFKVTEDGTKLVQAESDTSSNTTTMDIVELSNSNASLFYTEDGGTTEIDLVKKQ